ncbi:MAG TPA: DMT family transporter [Pyrinomonadaceae bacterium]|nr:DMT family transporter [Pyrinomonadaceae bacterium]
MNEKTAKSGYSPIAALLCVQALFGSLPVIAKVVLAVMPAVSLVGFRVSITAVALIIVQAFRKRLWLHDRSDYWRLGILSLFGVTLNQLLFIGGLSRTKASNTSLLAVTIPIFTLAVSAILGTEKLTLAKLGSIALAGVGVILLIDPRNASFSSQTTQGDMMIILNSLSFGIYVATSKDVITRNGAFRSMMWVFVFSSLVCLPLGIVSLSTVDAAAFDSTIWWLILYIALGATAVPYLLNAFAISKVSPSVVAVFIYLQPLIGFVLASIFLNEVLDLRFVVAAFLVFAGVYLTTRQSSATAAEFEQAGQKT